MFKRYFNSGGSRGSLAEVWIDESASLVKKFYKPSGKTIMNAPPLHTDMEEITRLFHNEIYWSLKINSDLILKTFEYGKLIDEPGYYIIQEWVGPDLLFYHKNKTLHEKFPNIKEQIIELFELFKEHDMYKMNNAMSNLTGVNGKIKAFDFKYSTARAPEHRDYEYYTITEWISKIDPSLCEILERTL